MSAPEPKLRRKPGVKERPPILQIMPGRRVRLDPTITRAVAVWLIAFSSRWTKEANASERGLKGAERDSFQKRREYYRSCVKAIGDVLCNLSCTQELDAIDAALCDVDWALQMHETDSISMSVMQDAVPQVTSTPEE